MGEIVNLRLFKKARARKQAEQAATAKRSATGLSRAEVDGEIKRRLLERARLDGAQLTPDDDQPGTA